MIESQAMQILNGIRYGKDGTLDLMGYELPEYGYLVGGVTAALAFESFEQANSPASLRKLMRFVEETPSRFVGWWTDSETGKVYVDGTSWHATEFEAGQVGRQRHEIAIFDIARQRELRLAYVDGERDSVSTEGE